jgi:hypothetical protein
VSGLPWHRSEPHWAGDRTLIRLRTGSCAAAPAPLVDGGPSLVPPVRDGGFIALPGSTRGLLGTPVKRLAQAADMGGMRGDAKLHAHDGGHASSGPKLAQKTIGFGALLQQGRQAAKLRPSQARWGSRRWPMAQRVCSAVPSACHSLTDGPFADAEGLGDLALGPTSWLETPSLQPSRLFPVAGRRVHASQDITRTAKL